MEYFEMMKTQVNFKQGNSNFSKKKDHAYITPLPSVEIILKVELCTQKSQASHP